MNNIIIYGPGCPKCAKLAEVTEQVMQELHLEAPLKKVTDAMQFSVAGVLALPALAVDDKILVSGRIPSRDEIRKILQEASLKDSLRQKSCCSGGQEVTPTLEDTPSPKNSSCCDSDDCCGGTTTKSSGGSGWKKAVVWVVVLLILFAAIKAINRQGKEGSKEPAAPTVSVESGVEAVYYKYGAKCPACIRMETWTREAVKKNFPDQFKEGKLTFDAIPANKEAVGKYGLTTKSLLLKKWKGGKETHWVNLDRIWDLNTNEQEFKEYVVQSIQKELDEFL